MKMLHAINRPNSLLESLLLLISTGRSLAQWLTQVQARKHFGTGPGAGFACAVLLWGTAPLLATAQIDCGCPTIGSYLDPVAGVQPQVTPISSNSGTSPHGIYSVSANVSGSIVNLIVTRISNGATLLQAAPPAAAYWGFSPDDDRFVYYYVDSGGLDNVYLFNLAGATPGASVSTEMVLTGSDRIQFSPHGNYFFYSAITAPSQTLLNVFDARTGNRAFQTEFTFVSIPGSQGDSFGMASWGFSPDASDRTFVYSWISGQTSAEFNLVNLETNLVSHSPSGIIHTETVTWTGFWQFSPCGDVLGLVAQPNQSQVDIRLFRTLDGTRVASPNETFNLASVGLRSTVSSNIANVGGTDYLMATNSASEICGSPGSTNGAPVAAFTYSAAVVQCSLQATFTDHTTDSNGAVVAWLWGFGDGTTSTQQNPTHTYATAGTYNVSLQVTDNHGATNAVLTAVSLQLNLPPRASFTFAPPAPHAGDTVTFTDTSIDDDNDITNRVWSFGSSGAVAQLQPTTTRTVTLTVYDACGRTSSATQTVPVSAPLLQPLFDPAADFSATNNPDRAWSYGYSLTLGGPLVLYTNTLNADGLNVWLNDVAAQTPNVYCNPTNITISNTFGQVGPGAFGLHPGTNGEFSVIRLTAPAPALYHVTGSFFGQASGGTTTDVHVLTNGVALLDGEVTGFGPGTGPSFDIRVTLNTGDHLDFAVGIGTDGQSGKDSTGLSVQIVPLVPVLDAHYQVLAQVLDPSGANTLIEGSDGVLYGTTAYSIFKLNRDGSGYGKLHAFGSVAGDVGVCSAGLVEGTDGVLYGTTRETVFKLNKDGSNYSILHTFNSSSVGGDGWDSIANLIQGSDGTLYGTTRNGGGTSLYPHGTVFKLNPDGSGYQLLYSFDANYTSPLAPSGYDLWGPLLEGSDGALYGAAFYGGGTNFDFPSGTAFRLNKDGSGFTVLHTFLGETCQGDDPLGGFLEGPDGQLYGTCYEGGLFGVGTVFKMDKTGSNYTTLYAFGGPTNDGMDPQAGLTLGRDGALYGTTPFGGYNWASGTVFRLNTDGTGYSQMIEFTNNSASGDSPITSLTLGRDGIFYGTTASGAMDPQGHLQSTIFKLWPPQTPDFLGIIASGNSVQVTLSGMASYHYELLRSTDLNQWSMVATFTMPTGGTHAILDSAPAAGRAFYLAAWVP
jgi:uncharacterized repeat protein (TIGR03803 family)